MLGLAEGAWRHATRYAQERRQFGKPIAEFQAVQFSLAQMATEIEAARLMVYNAARLKDAGQPFVREAAMAKLFASQVAALRPWNRTTASSGEVTTTSGGTLLLKPCGSSTITNGIDRSERNARVRSRFFSLSHEAFRNSTATRQPASRSTASLIRARFSLEGKTHFGYWRRIEPSCPRSSSGARAERNIRQTSSLSSAGKSFA